MKLSLPIQNANDLTDSLINWYLNNNRDLPWRGTKDPFKVWLSEIILQQTRVNQGLPYYIRFTETYSTIYDFASAPQDDILKLWQGLGYYSRARNMQECAKTVVNDYGGQFPNSYKELIKLKGIGKYTAAAIASICFDEKVPTVDGNVFRLLSRVFGIYDDIANGKTFAKFFDLAFKIMPDQASGVFNQSMMELGALICLPKKPKCDQCPIHVHCYAKAKSVQLDLPVKLKKIRIKHRHFDFYVVLQNNRVLVKSRESGDIWTGLYEFLLIEKKIDEQELPTTKYSKSIELFNHNLTGSSKLYHHQLTHQKLHIQFHVCEVNALEFDQIQKNFNMRSIDISEIDNLAVPKPVELFLKNEYLLLN